MVRHKAGEVERGAQCCTRCGVVLIEYQEEIDAHKSPGELREMYFQVGSEVTDNLKGSMVTADIRERERVPECTPAVEGVDIR